MSSGLAASTRPSRVMTATPTGASSAMVSRRSASAGPGFGAAPGSAESASPATNPAASWSRAAVQPRAPSIAGHAEDGGRLGRAAAGRLTASTSARRAAATVPPRRPRPRAPARRTAAKGSARSTPASLRRIVASRCSTRPARAWRPRMPGAACAHRCASRWSAPGSTASCGRSGPAWIAATPLPVRRSSDCAVRSRRHLLSPPRPRRVAPLSQCPPRSVIAPPQGVSPSRVRRTASQLPVT